MDQELFDTVDLNYIMCEYCGDLFTPNTNIEQNKEMDHITKCAQIGAGNYDDENQIVLQCFSCGQQNKTFSGSQLSKREKARCIQCVENSINQKAAPFKELAFLDPPKHINASLSKYVTEINYNKVKEMLEKGADSNYIRQGMITYRGRWRCLYKKDGSEVPEEDAGQPTTPLKMCVFRFSDCLLGDEEKKQIIDIAKLLIKYGAEKEGALDLYKIRYGDPKLEGENKKDEYNEETNSDWLDLFSLLSV